MTSALRARAAAGEVRQSSRAIRCRADETKGADAHERQRTSVVLRCNAHSTVSPRWESPIRGCPSAPPRARRDGASVAIARDEDRRRTAIQRFGLPGAVPQREISK